MKEEHDPLVEAFKQAKYQLSGQSRRNVQVLKDVLETVDGQLESDIYGNGEIIEDFQEKMANYLGKEAAVFFPSGTMAQQIALRIWCDQKGLYKVAYHPLSHLEINEEDGLKKLHHIETILLADKNRVIEFDDVLAMEEDVSCILLELPQRWIGGGLPDYSMIESISAFCREKGIKLHLDGARLFEILPYYQKTASQICELFDSVYISFYKGIGGIAGSILAGNQEFMKESKVWKRRYGGDLISLYPYILSSDYYFNQRIDNMSRYYEKAKELAVLFNHCHRVTTKPLVPVSNMFHVHINLPKEQAGSMFIDICKSTGIGFTGKLSEVSDSECYFEISVGDQFESIPSEELGKAFEMLKLEIGRFE